MDIINERYYEWLHNNCVSTMTEEEKVDSFYCELKFGTGGLRGKIGEGTNRMNFQTVGRASFGLANYLINKYNYPKIVIAYDSRKYSKEFAQRVADIMSYKGVESFIFSSLMPTPVLSYSVRKLGASAGVVITASHNPKEYNGYKVYDEKGCQITDLMAKEITSEISKFGYFETYNSNKKLINYLDDELLNDFINEVLKFSLFDNLKKFSPKVVYTPLCGTGRKPIKFLLEKMGINDVVVVKEQEMPDDNFSTCHFPNPEEESALSLAYEYANKYDAELILGTDPDADRVGVAERDLDGKIKRFTGNEIGLILLDFILKTKSSKEELRSDSTVVKTIVTSPLGERIAKKYNVQLINVLTGFKYIGEQIDILSSQTNFVFGFEESCGYLIGPYARDKDSIGAVMLIVEAKAYYKSKNKSLKNALDEIYKEHGYMVTYLETFMFEGKDGSIRKEEILTQIRNNPIKKVFGIEIDDFVDYLLGVNGLPKSNVMEFSGEGIKFIIRPSGTEPKLKIYYFVSDKSEEQAQNKLQKIREEMSKIINY